MKSSRLVLLSLVVLSLTGCASVLKGTDQVLTFTSDQDGAQVLLDGVSVGVTPLSMKVKKNSKSTVMVKKDGFRTQTMPLDKKYDGVALLNIFWDFSTTDLITGAAYEYEPNTYYFKLLKEDAAK
ncbi:MAG: PEGA domain-containing protein [Gallionella sp.]